MAKDGTIKINTELDSSKAQAAMSKFSGLAKTGLAGVAVAAGTVGTAMTAVAGYAIKVGSDFETGMSKISAISGATGEDLDALSEKAKEMGAKTKFSATEAASAFEYMAMAGWKTEDMLNGVEGVMNLAAASGEDLASVSDIVTDAITAFGLSASDSAHFADVLAKASSSANTNVGMMGETFKYAAPVAGALKYSIEDTATAIGLMANAGIKGGQAGTALRAMLARLVDPPKEAAEALDDLGISVTNTDGSMKPLMETLLDLRSGFSGLDESQRASYASSIAGQEAMSGLLAIVSASDSDFNSLVASINDADGAALSMADTMQDNLQGSMTILGSTIEGFGIKIYERMQEPLRKAADTGIECVNRISSAFDSGGVKGAVKEVGKLFDELTEEIADTSDEARAVITPLKNIAKTAMNLGKTVLPAAAKAFSLTAKNADKLVPTIIAGYTAFKTYGKVTTVIKAHAATVELLTLMEKRNALQLVATNGGLTLQQFLVATLNGQLTAATIKTALLTKAQAALNTVMAMNPIGLVAAAVGALVVGLGTYALLTDDATEKTYKFTDAEKENLKACKEHTDALNEQRTAREESVASIDREYSGYEKLLGELQSITDENGNVKAGYEDRARVITGELSNALGIEITMLDGQIQKYGEVVGAIKEVIVQKKAEALLSSMQDDMTKAYENSEKALNDYKNASDAATRAAREVGWAEDAVKEAQRKHDAALRDGTADMTKYKDEMEEAEARLVSAEEAQRKATKQMENSKAALEELSAEVNNYNALQEAVASGDIAKIESAITALVTSYKGFTKEALEASAETREAMYSQAEGYVESLGLIQNGTVQVADEIYGQMADAAAKTIENFNQLPGGIAQGITDIGPQVSSALISAMAQANIDGVLSEEAKAGLEGFISGFNGLEEDTQDTFAQAWYGALKGLEGFDKLVDPAEEGADAFLESLKNALNIHSPSKAVAEIFENVWPGAVQGLEGGQEELNEKGNGVIQSFLESIGGEGLFAKAQEVGANIMSFFGIGVSSQQENSRFAGKENADAANAGAGSVNPFGTGSLFGSLFGSGIGGMFSFLFGQGKGLSNAADSGAGSVDPANTGNQFGSLFGRGIGKAASILFGIGKANADVADSGAGSVDPTGTGEQFGTKYASGVGSKKSEAKKEGEGLVTNADNGSRSKSGYQPGSDFGAGFVNGINSWMGTASKAGANLANAAYESARRALDEHSPSRKTKKSGKNFDLGMAVGISDNEKYAVKAVENLSENALDALDIDAIYARMKKLDISGIMNRVNLAIDEKQIRASERIITEVKAKMPESSRTTESSINSSEIDYKRLGKEISKRPVIVVNALDGRETSRRLAVPMEQEMQNNARFRNMLKGEW